MEKNAVISDVSFSTDHGLLSAWLHLDYGDSSRQGFGGYNLCSPKHWRDQPNYCGHFIWRCMQVGGVDEWNALKGKTVRVRVDGGLIRAIGHIVRDDWFTPSVDLV